MTVYTIHTASGSIYELEVSSSFGMLTGTGTAGPIQLDAELADVRLPVIGERYWFAGAYLSRVVAVEVAAR